MKERRRRSPHRQQGIYRSSLDARCVVQYARGTKVQNASYQRCEHPEFPGASSVCNVPSVDSRGSRGGLEEGRWGQIQITLRAKRLVHATSGNTRTPPPTAQYTGDTILLSAPHTLCPVRSRVVYSRLQGVGSFALFLSRNKNGSSQVYDPRPFGSVK
eukprot:1192885-Prorocentrum_minimum.AAC.3